MLALCGRTYRAIGQAVRNCRPTIANGLWTRSHCESLEARQLLSDASPAIQLFDAKPAVFVANQGQWSDASVYYAYNSGSASIAFGNDGLRFQLIKADALAADPTVPSGVPMVAPATESTSFSMQFVGANLVTPQGKQKADGVYNYFIGDQANWRSNVPGYQTVSYDNLYDGVTLETFSQHGSMKYEFHVAPGADYQQVQIHYQGIQGLSIAGDGSLHVQTCLGDMVDDAPVIYQEIGGQRVTVAGKFVLLSDRSYAFEVTGQWDSRYELVLDPDLAWAMYLGGSGSEHGGSGIAVDSSGNVLMTGSTTSTDFAEIGSTSYGAQDAFVAKVSSSGSLLWTTYLGGSGYDVGDGITVSDRGDALVTGLTNSTDFAGMNNSSHGDVEAFVAKVSSAGSAIWAAYLGGSSSDWGDAIAIDSGGNVLVTGGTSSTDFAEMNNTYHGGERDAFVAKVSGSGSLLWATYLGGSSNDWGEGIVVDSSGNALITGGTSSTDFGGANNSSHGDLDAFVAKVSSSGSLLWTTYLGGSSGDWSVAIAIDSGGNALVTGSTYSTDFGAMNNSYHGGGDDFVAEVGSSGGLLWATYLGGSGDEHCGISNGNVGGIIVDGGGSALVTGYTESADFAGMTDSYCGGGDAFVGKVSGSGSLLWASYLGGSSSEWGDGIALDSGGNALVGGQTDSTDFAGMNNSARGNGDAFVAKIAGAGTPVSPTGQKTTSLVNESEVSWNPVAGASSYQVWRNTTNNRATATKIASGIKDTSYDDATATPGVTYYYWIDAANGSETSPYGTPTTGVADAGTGTAIKLGGLELIGAFSLGSGSLHTANGTIEIGFAPASGQVFQPLLTVDGAVSYDNSIISVDGTVSAAIGNLSLPVLTGNFSIPIGQVGETATSPNTVQDDSPSNSEKIAGLPIQITGLALIPAGSGAAVPEIEVKGSISLLGTTVSAVVLITAQGLQLETASIQLPPTDFSVGTLSVDATGMSLGYDVPDDQFVAQGKLTLKDLIHGASVTANLTGPGNGIYVHGSAVNLAGTLSLNDLTLPNGWGLKQASLSVNTLTNTYSGSADIHLPGLFDIGGSISFLNGHLNDLSLSLTNLAQPIPIVDVPGLSLTGGSASIINLAPMASGPVTLSGTLDLAYGLPITIDLPSWLGGSINTSIATMVLGASMSTCALSGSATLTVAGGLATLAGQAKLDFPTETLTVNGDVSLPGNVFAGKGSAIIGNGTVAMGATGTAQIPSSVIGKWLWWHPSIPNVPLANAGLVLSYGQSRTIHDDYVDIWGGASVGPIGIEAGVRVDFDASLSFSQGENLPQVDPPATATFSVASGTPWALLSAAWTNSSASVPFEIQSPDGTIYTASSLPSSIGVIDQADNSIGVTVGIQNPAPGNWTLTLLEASGLGTVSFQGVGGTVVSSTQLAFLQSPVNAVSGMALSPAVVVAIEDQNGDVITSDNSQVTLTMTGGPGNVTTVLTAKAVNGIATFVGVAPQSAGNYTFTATDGTDTSANATVTVAPSSISSVSFVQQPTDVVAGQTMTPAIVVQTKDQYGNVIGGDTVTLAVENYPSGAVYSAFTATTDNNGNATFGGISLPTAGSYVVVATDGTVSSDNSSTFAVSPAAASMLVFAHQPNNVAAGTAINPSIVIDVEDQFGNLISTDSSTVFLSLNGEGYLNGVLRVQAQNGVATFSGVSVNGAGVYAINAGDGILAPVTSAGFTVSAATAAVSIAPPPAIITYDGTADVSSWAVSNVSGANGVANPTGLPRVLFYAGNSATGTPLASAPVNPGTYTAVANYAGDVNYGTCFASPVTFVIHAATTSTALTSSTDQATSGQTLTFTAAVSPSGPTPGTPTGTVQFQIDGSDVGTPVPLSGGMAVYVCSAASLAAGSHSVAATYSGDASFSASTGRMTQTVITDQAPTDIALSNTSVAENEPAGTAVGTLSAVDPDAGDTAVFTLVTGTGSGDNGSFTIVGSQLTTAEMFNYAVKSSYSIRVQVMDSGGLTFEKVLTVNVTSAAEPLVIDGTAGADTITVTSLDGNLLRYSVNGTAHDFLASSVSINGLDGNDLITVDSSVTLGVTIDGGTGSDTITGGSGADLIMGGAGLDVISGGGGNDTLSGGAGADLISGGGGADLIVGGAGADTLSGNLGSDTILGGTGSDVLYGQAGNDSLNGGAGNDTICGAAGADTIVGGAGNNLILGGAGNDFIDATNTTTFRDTVDGGTGIDTVHGDSNDILTTVETSVLM